MKRARALGTKTDLILTTKGDKAAPAAAELIRVCCPKSSRHLPNRRVLLRGASASSSCCSPPQTAAVPGICGTFAAGARAARAAGSSSPSRLGSGGCIGKVWELDRPLTNNLTSHIDMSVQVLADTSIGDDGPPS